MSAIRPIYEPVVRLEGVERLNWLDWDEIHSAVQSSLQALDAQVIGSCPGARVVEGQNSGPTCDLFSYRVFRPPTDSAVDPVVVGVSFSKGAQSSEIIHGDICGETLGDVLLDLPPREVIGWLAQLEAARDLAERMSKHADMIAAALLDQDRLA